MLIDPRLIQLSASRHRDHLCPRQVLGVRMGLYAGEVLSLALPDKAKRLFTIVETDGCMTDGIAVATGCWWGSRTMRLIDYGKAAATFVDTQTERAVRISPTPGSRQRALDFAPLAADPWHAQLEAYQVMPSSELLRAEEVTLAFSLSALLSRHGLRVVCERCGEDIINERQVEKDGRIYCQACALDSYYRVNCFAL